MNLGRGLARAPMLARQAFKQPSAAKTLASIGPMRAAAKNGRGMGSIGASQINLAFDTTPTVNFNMGPLVLGAFEECFVDNEFKDPTLAALDERLGGMLKKACAENQFTGKPGASCQLRLVAPGAPPLLILRGLGKLEHAASNSWSSFARAAAVELRTGNWEHVGVALATGSEAPPAELTASSASAVKTIGANLQAFATPDNRFKSETKSEQSTAAQTRFHFLGFDDDVQPALDQAAAVARGIRTAVELVNAPANVVTPAALAELAQKLDKEHACMTTQILEKEDCKAYGEHGMGLFLGVAQGSSEAPKFIHISYKPNGPVRRKIALVGKGVTFDSGGLNIKAGAGSMIELMKFDMGGAAAVFGAAVAIADLAPEDVQVDFIVAACENMINGNALKPGDVIKASNGTTVEVDNTDAEGRLTMADALLYAQQLECDEVVDIATLTGACVVALGDDVAGMVTNNDTFGQQVLACSKAAGERVWQLPMERAYRPLLDSYTADILNAGPRAAGAITAALFLDTFVKPEMRWAHIDIAGPVYEIPKGRATGFGVSTLVELALRK